MRWIEKMIAIFFMVSTSSITMKSLGKIVLRAPDRCENVVFVFLSRSESGALCVRWVHSSNKHCVAVYESILMRFSVFFLSKGITLSNALHFIFVARWRHSFHEIVGKMRKVQKSAEKFVRTTSYR